MIFCSLHPDCFLEPDHADGCAVSTPATPKAAPSEPMPPDHCREVTEALERVRKTCLDVLNQYIKGDESKGVVTVKEARLAKMVLDEMPGGGR